MKNKFYSLLFLTMPLMGISNNIFAQETKDSTEYKAIQNKAEPLFKLSQYLSNNLRYPKTARQEGIQGKVKVEFIVEKDGRISNVRVIKGKELGHGLPEEAIRVVSNMPKWKPAVQNGLLVRSYFTLPIQFKLDDGGSKKIYREFQFAVDSHIILKEGAQPSFNYLEFLNRKLVYPTEARKNKIQATVSVKFIVEKDGSISNVTLEKSTEMGYGIPEEALRVIKLMPTWAPAIDTKGETVRSYNIISVPFKLQ